MVASAVEGLGQILMDDQLAIQYVESDLDPRNMLFYLPRCKRRSLTISPHLFSKISCCCTVYCPCQYQWQGLRPQTNLITKDNLLQIFKGPGDHSIVLGGVGKLLRFRLLRQRPQVALSLLELP